MNSYVEPKITVLLTTNGKRTERQYLDWLKDLLHKQVGYKYSVSVKFIEGDPERLFRKLTSPLGDISGYNHVWLVVDKDDNDLSQFLKKCLDENNCRQEKSKNNFFKAIVSNPCFEVWLIAHYNNLKNYQNQEEAKRHFAEIVGRSPNDKHLPDRFPFENYLSAIGKICNPEESCSYANIEGMAPFSGMPEIFDFYGLSKAVEGASLGVECSLYIAEEMGEYRLISNEMEKCGNILISGLLDGEDINYVNLKFHLFCDDFKNISGHSEKLYQYETIVDEKEKQSGYLPVGEKILSRAIDIYSTEDKKYQGGAGNKILILDKICVGKSVQTELLVPRQVVSLRVYTNKGREILLIQKYEEGGPKPVEYLIL